MRRIFLFAAALLVAAIPSVSSAQGREITGKVTQKETGAPVNEATVSLVGQPLGVRTNAAGEYRLRVLAGEATVLIRAIGYKRQSVKVAGATQDFVLEKDVLQLEGVTVTGQATTIDRRNSATAIASVSAEELMKAPPSRSRATSPARSLEPRSSKTRAPRRRYADPDPRRHIHPWTG